MLFIEDINGTPVSKDNCTIIHKFAYNMWIDWAKKGLAADQWGTVGENLKAEFQKKMIKAFPVVGMSALGWKIDKLATQYYPVWIQSNQGKIQTFQQQISEQKITETLTTSMISHLPGSVEPTESQKARPKSTKDARKGSRGEEVMMKAILIMQSKRRCALKAVTIWMFPKR